MNSIKHTTDFDIKQPIDHIFPLFSPEGEKLWVPGWDYENVMGTNLLSEDYVFLTKTHDHASTDAIWLVKKYEPDYHHIQFYKIEPEDKIGMVTVQCMSRGLNLTNIKVTYKYIALSPKGRDFIQNFTQDIYAEFIGEWKTLLQNYYQD